MLLELPTADEIDELAADTPDLVVRRFELDLLEMKFDMDYTPCKGEAVVVTKRREGVFLLRKGAASVWTLPSGRIAMDEAPEEAGARVVSESCGIDAEGMRLRALYDVTRHYGNISVKRLLVVYECEAGSAEPRTPEAPGTKCALHTDDLDKLVLEDIDAQAIADCM
ncbi:MAG: NUDIX hydrolase [Methanobacteriota archaeon]|nr:MAG: NUDIX hydrolase [Euryarchaeota archaeon]